MSAPKGSTLHQIEMAVARATLRAAAIPPADACGRTCDCTYDCERAFAWSPPKAGEGEG